MGGKLRRVPGQPAALAASHPDSGDQNWKRAEICMFRGGRTDVTAPKPVLLPVSEAMFVGVRSVRLTTFRVELMPSNCVWLKVLNVSSRSSHRARSLIRISFESEISQLLMGARYRKLRPDSSPRLPSPGVVNAEVSNMAYGSPLFPLPGFFRTTMRPPSFCCVPVTPYPERPGIVKLTL